MKLVSLSGPAEIQKFMALDPRTLNDVDAGIWALVMLDKAFPGGVTLRDLRKRAAEKRAGRGRALGNLLGDFGNWIADKSGDAWDKVAGGLGDAGRFTLDLFQTVDESHTGELGRQLLAAKYGLSNYQSTFTGLKSGQMDAMLAAFGRGIKGGLPAWALPVGLGVGAVLLIMTIAGR